jgi:hypothetical protein
MSAVATNQNPTLPFNLPRQTAPDDIERFGHLFVVGRTRPTGREDIVASAAAAAVLPEVLSWLADEGAAVPTRAAVAADIMKVAFSVDGFEAVRRLESIRWTGNGLLVEILDALPLEVDSARRRLEAVWVQTCGIVSPFTIGQAVFVRTDPFKDDVVDGKIVEIDAKHGYCGVQCASLGHVRSGHGVHCFSMRFEDVSDAPSLEQKLAATTQ